MRPIFFILACMFLSAVCHAQSGAFEIAQIDVAAGTFTGKLNGQMRTFRVRPGVEVSINGLKATFAELEPGMKVQVTSADPGVATKLAATGFRTRQPAPTTLRPPVTGGQAARQVKATIPANAADAFPIGDIRKGTKISLQYSGGKWKSWGRIPTENPDDAKNEGGDACRVVISLPSKNGKSGEVLAILPAGTEKHPFVFDAQQDYPGLVLRINDKDDSFSGNPGSVEYTVKILPPIR
jgi:hypothetical protein